MPRFTVPNLHGGMMYTDLILYKRQFNSWEDLEAGKIAESNAVVRYEEKYARPGLTNLFVDEDGNLISPRNPKYAKEYIASYTKLGFKFGDLITESHGEIVAIMDLVL